MAKTEILQDVLAWHSSIQYWLRLDLILSENNGNSKGHKQGQYVY